MFAVVVVISFFEKKKKEEAGYSGTLLQVLRKQGDQEF